MLTDRFLPFLVVVCGTIGVPSCTVGCGSRECSGGKSPDAAPGASGLPFLREYGGRTAPPFVGGGTAPPATEGADVSVRVNAGKASRSLPRTLYGNNASVWNADILWSETSFERLKTANVSILRFPGGSTSDTYHWDGQYPAHAQSQSWMNNSASWAVSTAEYMGLVRRLGSIPVITANYGYAIYDTTATDGNVANAARLAADWVEYCNAPNDGKNPNGGTDWAAQRAADGSPEPYAVAYWEIGNETFGAWEVGHDRVGDTYARNFNVIADAMKAVDPTIAIGLIVDPTPTYANWTRTVLSNPGTIERADFLIVHTYFGNFGSAASVSAPELFAKSVHVRELKVALDELVASTTTRKPGELPYYLSEYNVTGPTNRLQISLASGIFIAKVLGELAASGWAAASLWDVLNGYDSPGTYGAGDHGFLSLREPNVPDLTPRPTYYDFYFFTRNFGDHLVDATSSDAAVSVYASTFTGGGVGIIVVNEAPDSRSLSITVDGASLSGRGNAWILTGPALDGSVVTLNGVGNAYPSGGPLPEAVSPYAFDVSTVGATRVDVPGSSVASVMLF